MFKKICVFLMLCILLGCGSTGITSVITSTSSTIKLTTNSTNNTTIISSSMTNPTFDYNWFNLSGFAQGLISNRIDSEYVEVNNELEFLNALKNSNIKIIEIKSNLDLGFNELSENIDVSRYSFIKSHNKPLIHPILLKTGVSKINIENRKSLMIYSQNGNTISHAGFILKRCEDIVIRNLKFSELWEFDEYTKGEHDRNDWDYFTLEASNGIWLDHLEFSKAYDGLVDLKNGTKNVTISWSKFIFEPNDFLYSQFEYLEANKDNYPMYKFLRDGGMSIDDIVLLNSSQKKGHLIGSSELEESNRDLSLTLHHNLYKNLQDRLPRLRAGNVHLYNVILDNSKLLNTKTKLTLKYPKIMSSGTYKINITNQGIVTTENGAVLMENSIFRDVTSPIKNNQKNTELRYTGKYEVINSIYDYEGNKYLGGSSEEGSPFVGKPVSPIEFGWNQIVVLPYNYNVIETNDLEALMYEGYVGALETNLDWLNIKEVVR